MQATNTFDIVIYSLSSCFKIEEVTSVQLNTFNGEVGILPHHVNMVFDIVPCVLTIVSNHKTTKYVISAGIAKFVDNELSIMANNIVDKDTIDKDYIEKIRIQKQSLLKQYNDNNEVNSLSEIINYYNFVESCF